MADDKIKVQDLPDTESIQMTNELMVLVDSTNNYVNNITINDFNANIISQDNNNIISQGTDGGLFAETATITQSIIELTNSIGDLNNLQTSDKSSIVNSINEIASTTVNGANVDLSNLTSTGNAKFQNAPFSINNGTVDSNGKNATLTSAGGTPVSVDKYVVPQLSSNNSEYGTCNDYTMTGTGSASFSSFTNPWTMELASDNHIPSGATVTFTIAVYNSGYNYQVGAYYASGCTGCKITYTYTDDTTEVIFDENRTGDFASWSFASGAHSATITLPVANKEVKAIQLEGYKSFGQNYNYYNAWGITFRAQYDLSSSGTLICNPCTITTADSKSKTFEYDNLYDCSNEADGTYKVMKSYTDGSLNLASTLLIQKNAPTASNGDLWLDTSEYPLTLRQYDGTNWQTNNDLVYIGDVTVGSGVITAITNNPFNSNMGLLSSGTSIVETYQNGASWYRIYSDGWCEQGGSIPFNTGTGGTITFLKVFKDTNYTILTGTMGSASHMFNVTSGTFTPSSITWTKSAAAISGYWEAKGYLAEGEY